MSKQPKLSERKKLIVALLKTYGSSPIRKIIRVVYPGQEVFFTRQWQYLIRSLKELEELGLIECEFEGELDDYYNSRWKAKKNE